MQLGLKKHSERTDFTSQGLQWGNGAVNTGLNLTINVRAKSGLHINVVIFVVYIILAVKAVAAI